MLGANNIFLWKMYIYTINFSQTIGYITKYNCIFYKDMHKHSPAWNKKNPNLDQFYFY